MRRRQIIGETERAQKAAFVLPPDAKFSDIADIQPVRELRAPADHEACALCGRRKYGRPKR